MYEKTTILSSCHNQCTDYGIQNCANKCSPQQAIDASF